MPDLIKGTFLSTTYGYGFVSTETEGEPDIFIREDNINGALHTDTVEIKLIKSGRARPEGAVERIISRGCPLLAGTFCTEKKENYILALEPKIPWAFPVSKASVKKLGLVDGHRVMFGVSVSGRVSVNEIFGHKNDPGMDILSLVRQYNVPHAFSEKSLSEAAHIPDCVSDEDLHGRADLRDWPIITIDGSDTKDIDDAISIKTLDNGNFELGVHIADVSHYVRTGSSIDAEARLRGTSIYLTDRVIPMLPHSLSNGICSLNPDVDRLTLSCIMEIDRAGNVVKHKVKQSVIYSKKQFTYDEAAAIINGAKSDWVGYLTEMSTLAQILREKRIKRGALEFNFKEAKIIADSDGLPIDIVLREASASTALIEEFMIVCNETIAEAYQKKPFVFRTHEAPDVDKMYQLSAYAQNLGYKLPVSHKGVKPAALQKLISNLDPALEPVILRSLKQARYTMENTGHFGLASTCYCHFTSPIRRYPDLLVHRAIKGELKKRGLMDLCIQCSQTERTAESLERDVMQLKKVQYMLDKIGFEFTGTVSSVVSWGFYVQLPNTVEGLVPMDTLKDDEYVFAEKQLAIFGVRTKKRIRLGDKIRIKVSAADINEKKLTFELKQIL